ncbi:MAG: hypothetical protein IPK81_23920 [Rhodospirillales bacterium]|nr:MAG: hypothetical protein IPK81_23920 [Rhodospirillales bacterium]
MDDKSPEGRVAAFFDQFNDAFASFKGERVAALYHAPGIALRGGGAIDVVPTTRAIATFFQAALDEYHREGARTCAWRDLSVVEMGSKAVLATVTWALLDAAGANVRTWRQSYNLVRVDDGWRVYASTYHEA